MANVKISELTAITSSDDLADADIIPLVDSSDSTTKRAALSVLCSYFGGGGGSSVWCTGTNIAYLLTDCVGIGTATPGTDIMFRVQGDSCYTGDLKIGGDVCIGGDDLFMGTNTSGHMLVADGTNFNPVAMSGDVAIDSAGATTIQATSVENSMLAGSIANAKLANDSVSYGGVSLDLGGTDATPAFNLCDATAYKTSNLAGTITNSQLAGSIANAKLANDSVSYGGVSVDLGSTDATPAFNLCDATGYPTSSLVGTITNAQLAGSIANGKLANDSVSYGGVSVDLGSTDATPAFNLCDATAYKGDSALVTVGTIASGTWNGTAIGNSYLANSSVSYGGISVDLGSSDATPAFNLCDATAYKTTNLVGTITNTQLAGSIANSKLSNSSVSYGGVSVALGATDATPAFNLCDATAYKGDSALVTVGTVTSGTWQGTAIATAYIAGTICDKILASPVLCGTITGNAFLDEDNMASDSATKVASQQSIKAYVDSVASGLDLKCSSHAATTANLSAAYNNGTSGVGATLTNSGTQAALSVDGQTMASGERVLVKDQSTAAQNGIYTVTTVGDGSSNWVLTRATDFDTSTEITSGAFTFVETGSSNADSGWVMTTDGTVTVGTTSLAWSQFSGAGQITAGDGLTKSGNTLNVGAGSNLLVSADAVAMCSIVTGLTTVCATNFAGTLATAAQANVTSLGTLTALTVDSICLDGTTIGHTSDTDLITLADGSVTIAGDLTATGDISFDGGAFVFNESGADKDFRIEGDSDANLLIADASTDRIGIGTATPDYTLHVAGNIGVDEYIYHNGDPNTYLCFTDDRLRFNIGGIPYIDLNDAGDAPHDITFNDNANNVDFIIKGDGSNGGNPLFKTDASTGRVGINGVGSPSYELDVDGSIGLAQYLYHRGDDDTYLSFPTGDKIYLVAGGVNFMYAWQKDSDTNRLYFNFNNTDTDISFRSVNKNNLFYLDACTDMIGIGTSTPSHLLDVEGVAHFATCIVTPTVCTTGDTVIDGDLTVSGDDITMGTNTSGHILVADGTNYNPVAVSGDVTISNTGAVTIAATSVENSMLAGSIANAKLANDSVSYGGISLDLGETDATPAFNLCDATAYKGDSALVTVGTIASGTWNGTAIASAYLDSDTAHLSGTQTFSGAKTFSAAAQFSNTVTVGVDDTGYDVKFFGATAGRYLLWDESNDRLKFRDNTKLVFGQSNDLEIYHDATDSIITNCTGTLKVLGDVSFDGGAFIFNESGADKDFRIEGDTNTHLFFTDASTDRVGIGTTAPDRTLTVDGSVGVKTASATGNPQIAFRQNTTDKAYLTYWDASDTLALTNAAGAGLHFDPTNVRVGIGTTAPDGPLHVYTASAGSVSPNANEDDLVIENSTNGGITILTPDANDSSLVFGSPSDSVGAVVRWNHDADLFRVLTANAGASMTLETGGGTEAVRIDSSQRVGIGTTAPDGKLHVFASSAGSVTASSLACAFVIESAGNGGMTFLSPDDAYGQILWNSPTSGGGLCSSNARIAAGYNGGAQRLDISVGGCGSALTVFDTGCVNISGVLAKGSGSFTIEHPLESKKDTHRLVHSFIEGPQADLMYRGIVQLVDGSAQINIDTVSDMTDGTFVALNRCAQVFTTNESNWDAVRGSVTENILTIESNTTNSTACISWMVVGERCDQHMMDTGWTHSDGRIIVEPEKTE